MKKPTSLDPDIIKALASATQPVAPTPEMAARIHNKLFQRIHSSTPNYLFIHHHQGEWINLTQGLDFKLLREDAVSRSFLLRLAPGARIPPHEHRLEEESLVLEGDATINGVLCLAGDYHLAARGKPHDWVTSENGCLLFVRGAIEQQVLR